MTEIHAGVIKHVLRGCVSDPPGMAMYFEIGRSPEGLPTYKGKRSSSALEVDDVEALTYFQNYLMMLLGVNDAVNRRSISGRAIESVSNI